MLTPDAIAILRESIVIDMLTLKLMLWTLNVYNDVFAMGKCVSSDYVYMNQW